MLYKWHLQFKHIMCQTQLSWHIRCIRVIEFWRLKLGFGRSLSSNARKICFYQPCTFDCVWKGIWSREQNYVPESGRASLCSVKVIKMSRLAIDRLLILWSLHGSCRYCKTDCETDCRTFLAMDVQDVVREQVRWARNCAFNPLHFNRTYVFVWWHLNCFTCIWLKSWGYT